MSLGFDLYRGASSRPSEWPHAREALLVVGYGASALGYRWTCAQLAVSQDGLPGTCADDGSTVSQEDGRVIVYPGAEKSGSWVNREWLFAVPLRAIESSAALEREIVGPLASLLFENALDGAFDDTKAVEWASMMPEIEPEGHADRHAA